MPTIMLRGLQGDLVTRLREHGEALGAQGDRDCALALIEYAIDQREARSAGAAAVNEQRTPAERSAVGRHAAAARWKR